MSTPQGLTYLRAAQRAVEHTMRIIKWGPANQPQFQKGIVPQLRAMGGLLKTREAVDKALKDRFVSDEDALRHVRIYAEKAEKFGAGNCEEHSSVAYLYLWRAGVVPLDWCRWTKGDHAFVIVGRPASRWNAKAIPTEAWFPDAVICDPLKRYSGFWQLALRDYPPDNITPMLHQEVVEALTVWKNK